MDSDYWNNKYWSPEMGPRPGRRERRDIRRQRVFAQRGQPVPEGAGGGMQAALRARHRQQALAPMRQRQQMMMNQMPLSDREKMYAEFGQEDRTSLRKQMFDIGTAERGEQADVRSAGALRQHQIGMADTASKRAVTAADVTQQGKVDIEGQRQQGAKALERLRWQEPQPATIPSIMEQKSQYVAQFPIGSPEWTNALREIEALNDQPPDVQLRQLQILNAQLTAFHKTYPVDSMGRMMAGGEPIGGLTGINQQIMGQIQGQGGMPPQNQEAPPEMLARPTEPGLPQPQTEEELMALPDGTKFIAPDGSVRIK